MTRASLSGRKPGLWPVVLLGLAAVLGACAVNPVTGGRDLVLLSERQEVELGQKQFPLVLQRSGGVYRDAALEAYIQGIGLQIARIGHRPDLPYQFRVANASSVNAFALPGGPIAIHRGLLVALENEAQLAAVLAHELGHVTARHAVRALSRHALMNLTLLGLGVAVGQAGEAAPILLAAGQLSGALVLLRYNREDEHESDRLAVEYLVRAGYDPGAAIQLHEFFLTKLERGEGPGWLEGLFRTHPPSRERLEATRQQVARVRAVTGTTVDPALQASRFRERTAAIREVHRAYLVYDEAERLLARGLLADAERKFREALALNSDQAPFWTGLGAVFFQRGDDSGAERYLRRAVALDADLYRPYLHLGRIALRQHRHWEAMDMLRRSVRLLPTREAVYYKGVAHEALGEIEVAADSYRAVVQAGREDALGRQAAARLEPLQLRLTPWEVVTATGQEWRQDPSSRRMTHAVRLTNTSTRTIWNPRLRFEYVTRKGRSLGSQEVVVPLTLRPGESKVVSDLGGWPLAGEARQVSLKVIEVNMLGPEWR